MLHHMLRAAAGRDRIPTDGLVAWYTMDNISGSTLVDETGNSNGTISGATQVSGLIGQALSFDGADDKVDLPVSLGTGNFTISAWLETTNLSGDTMALLATKLGTDQRILLYANTNFGSANNQMRLFFDSEICAGSSDIRNTGWRNIVLERDGNSWALYLDNVLDGSGTKTGDSGDGVIIGNDPILSRDLNGLVDIFRIYNRTLTSAEKTALYNEGA